MEDSQIIDLYWARLEQAIQETDTKYGGYCRAIAHNILKSMEDSEECVSDTWLRAWNAMPPQRPSVLSAFLGRITRNLSLDRYKAARAEKRTSASWGRQLTGFCARFRKSSAVCFCAGTGMQSRSRRLQSATR